MNKQRTETLRWLAGRPVAMALLLALALSPIAVGKEDGDPFAGALFEVELVLGNQSAIGLDTEQRAAIVRAIQHTQSTVVPAQLEMSAVGERLLRLLESPRIDVEAAVDAAAEAMRLENSVKLEHVRLLIEVKNLLTREQQSKLRSLRPNG